MAKKIEASQKWSLILFTIGVFMAGLDNGIISTALTTINESFHVTPVWGAWTVTLYTLGIAISAPIIGKLSDRYGRRRLFIIEIVLFGLGSLLVAISPNFIFMLTARFIQAIGGGGIFIIGSSHILTALPKDKQGKALGLLGGMHGIAAVIGPNLGAVILNITGSWQWMFLINIPIALFLILFGVMKLEESQAVNTQKLDIAGAVLLSLAILFVMFGITNLNTQDFLTSVFEIKSGLSILLGIILFGALLVYERNVEQVGKDPMLSYSLLKLALFRYTLLLGLLSGGFLAGIIFIPAFVQQVLNVPVQNAGYWLTPMAVASGIGAGLGGFLTDKIGAVKTVVMAGLTGVAGFGMFPYFVVGLGNFVIASTLAGVGLGILLGAPLNVLVGECAADTEKGSALGTLSLIRQIGLTIFPTVYAGFITVAPSVVKVGFDHLFITTSILSTIVFAIGLILNYSSVAKGEY